VSAGGGHSIVTRQPHRHDRRPALALAVETEDLGIAAGLQDRVAQAYQGLVFMDFERGRNARLDASLLGARVAPVLV